MTKLFTKFHTNPFITWRYPANEQTDGMGLTLAEVVMQEHMANRKITSFLNFER